MRESNGAPVATFVVWEPILVTDVRGAGTAVLARVSDRRAAQFWDRAHLVSQAMGGPPSFGPKSGADIRFEMKKHVWDFVGVYAPGFRWRDSAASPSFAGAPVVEVVQGLRAAIQAELSRRVGVQ